jgi:hypothetical protein
MAATGNLPIRPRVVPICSPCSLVAGLPCLPFVVLEGSAWWRHSTRAMLIWWCLCRTAKALRTVREGCLAPLHDLGRAVQAFDNEKFIFVYWRRF